MPFTDFSDFEKDPELEKMSKLFTVDMIINFVEWKLEQPTTEMRHRQNPEYVKPES